MLFMEKMTKIELLVLRRDIDGVLRYLGLAGCLQLIAESHEQAEPTPEERQTAELKGKIEAVARFLELDGNPPTVPSEGGRSRNALREEADEIISEAAGLIDEEMRLVQLRVSLRHSLDELSAFSSLTVPLSDLTNLTYLAVRRRGSRPGKGR